MADDVDRANDRMERELSALLRMRKSEAQQVAEQQDDCDWCGRLIPSERIRVLPGTIYCSAACSEDAEKTARRWR